MTEPSTYVSALDRAGYRLTEPRRSLAALIADHDGHFTAAELVAEARSRRLGVGRATVFRTLEVLEELGAIERLDLPSGEHAYVGCEPIHHHHVVCSRCGRTVEIEDEGLRDGGPGRGPPDGFPGRRASARAVRRVPGVPRRRGRGRLMPVAAFLVSAARLRFGVPRRVPRPARREPRRDDHRHRRRDPDRRSLLRSDPGGGRAPRREPRPGDGRDGRRVPRLLRRREADDRPCRPRSRGRARPRRSRPPTRRGHRRERDEHPQLPRRRRPRRGSGRRWRARPGHRRGRGHPPVQRRHLRGEPAGGEPDARAGRHIGGSRSSRSPRSWASCSGSS